jgi:anti-sigma-K factor RskA
MNWYHSRQAVDELAAQYVLGTLRGPARRRFVAVMAQRPEVAARVQDWEAQLHRLAQRLPEVQPSPALWERLADEAGLAPRVEPTVPARAAATPVRTAPAPPAPGFTQRVGRFFQSLLSPVPAGALAFGLMAGLGLPVVLQALNPPPASTDDGQTALPASYIGVLATPQGRPGLIVASLRHGRTVDLKQVSPIQPPAGQTLFLWTIDAQGQVQAVGPIPAGGFVQAPLADTAEKVFAKAVELAVSVETNGSAPAAPSGAFVYRGLCGKVWRVPAAGAPAASRP